MFSIHRVIFRLILEDLQELIQLFLDYMIEIQELIN
jgi:hypothetical protein